MLIMNYEEKLIKFKEKYLTREQKTGYYKEVENIIRDLKFFKEYIRRTKTNQRFNFVLIPCMDGVIYSSFLKQMMLKSEYYLEDKEVLELLLIIFDITLKLFSIITENLMEENILLYSTIKDLIEWDEITNYFTGVNPTECIGCFVGSSWQCEKIEEIINRIRNTG